MRLPQPEKAQDRHNNDDQPDDVDNAVHVRLRSEKNEIPETSTRHA
jgi:hypothetical protein